MKTKLISLILAILTVVTVLAGCVQGSDKPMPAGSTANVPPTTDNAQPVTLIIAGAWEDCKAIEDVARKFTTQYPNCTIEYEYLQDYYTALQKRMTGDNAVDLFFCTNIQSDSDMLPYALDLNSRSDFDKSNTFQGLVDNFTFREENPTGNPKLYSMPLGAEMRGLYINKTLLDSLNIAIPTNQSEILAACETLKANGYIPFHGNPGDFSRTLLYPWICNLIANADDKAAAYEKVNKREAGVSEMFREPFEFLYTLIENNYYDYKRAQTELNLFNESTDIDAARYFLNIAKDGENYKKVDDVGQIAFMPYTMSLESVVAKTKTDYHSGIEYVFAPAPIGKDGGFAYMSPAHGIAANKASVNIDWAVKFLDFLFRPENNKLFAEEFNAIPNTKEAFSYISTLYDIPADRVSQLGQVTFDYDFYSTIVKCLTETSKANNPKYMQTDANGATSLYPFEYYMNNLEASLVGNEE